jgi:hypothetical protein
MDLEGCLDSAVFRSFLEEIGTGLRFVPTGTNRAKNAEKAVDMVKVELVSAFLDYPDMPSDRGFQAR